MPVSILQMPQTVDDAAVELSSGLQHSRALKTA